MNWRKSTAAITIALMLVLAGCAGGAGSGATELSSTATSTATPTPTKTSQAATPSPTETPTATPTPESSLTDPKKGEIVEIVDSDTYKIAFESGETKTISLLGVDIPNRNAETVSADAFGYENNSANREHLAKYGAKVYQKSRENLIRNTVTVVYDTEASAQTGEDGHKLAYVYADWGTLFNKDFIKRGWARATDTTHEYSDKFRFTEKGSINDKTRIWSKR